MPEPGEVVGSRLSVPDVVRHSWAGSSNFSRERVVLAFVPRRLHRIVADAVGLAVELGLGAQRGGLSLIDAGFIRHAFQDRRTAVQFHRRPELL